MAADALDNIIYGSHSPISSFFVSELCGHPACQVHSRSQECQSPPRDKSPGAPSDRGRRSLQISLCCRSAATVSTEMLRWDGVALPMPLTLMEQMHILAKIKWHKLDLWASLSICLNRPFLKLKPIVFNSGLLNSLNNVIWILLWPYNV